MQLQLTPLTTRNLSMGQVPGPSDHVPSQAESGISTHGDSTKIAWRWHQYYNMIVQDSQDKGAKWMGGWSRQSAGISAQFTSCINEFNKSMAVCSEAKGVKPFQTVPHN